VLVTTRNWNTIERSRRFLDRIQKILTEDNEANGVLERAFVFFCSITINE
jgi:hypothetical protein